MGQFGINHVAPPEIDWSRGGFTLNSANLTPLPGRMGNMKIEEGYIYLRGNSMIKIYVKSSYELGYFFGAVIAKGEALRYPFEWPMRINSMEPEHADKLIAAIDNTFGITASITRIASGLCVVNITSRTLFHFFDLHFGRYRDRKIPNELLVGHGEYLLGILDALEEIWLRKPPINQYLYLFELYILLTDAQESGKIPLERKR